MLPDQGDIIVVHTQKTHNKWLTTKHKYIYHVMSNRLLWGN